MEAALYYAQTYLERGWRPIPVPRGEKGPTLRGWQNLQLDDSELPTHFACGESNVGVLLGEASNGLVDVDLDCPEAITLAETLLPPTGCIFGRSSAPCSHYLYKANEPLRTERHNDPSDGSTLVELRATGAQTVFPGSIHPSGEPIEFHSNEAAGYADWKDLSERVAQLAAAALLARQWPKGSRHDVALALSGALLRGDRSESDISDFITAICRAAGDEEVDDRMNAVKTTARLLKEGKEVTGIPSLSKIMGQQVTNKVCEWLRLGQEPLPAVSSESQALQIYGKGTPNTDVANAHRFAAQCGRKAKYCHQLKKWLVWDGSRWTPDGNGEVQRMAMAVAWSIPKEAGEARDTELLKWAKLSQSDQRIQSMIRLARSLTIVRKDELDTDPWLLSCRNGTLDLRTGELRQHDPDNLNTMVMPVEFAPDAKCPQWHQFLARIMGDDKEVIEFLKRAAGYSLTGDAGEQCLFLLHGTGANGKSTFLSVLQHLLGDYAKQTPMETLMSGRPGQQSNDLARLDGTRLVCATEAEHGQKLAEAKIKAITGGDRLSVRFLYGEYFEFTPRFKLWLATNRLPDIQDTSDGIWRRIHAVDFSVTIPPEERDGNLTRKLLEELPGILNWAIEGCLEWRKTGLSVPEAVQMATSQYRSDMDHIAQFLSDYCAPDSKGEVSVKDLYEGYADWAHENGEPPLAKNAFGKSIKERGFKQKPTSRTRYWAGLRLKLSK